MTIVLYFGNKPWGGELSLLDCLDVPDALAGLVNDWRVPVFDMARLDESCREKLRGDLLAVADYLSQTKGGGMYDPPGGLTLTHPADTMRTMRAITGDRAWEDAILPRDEREETTTMTEVLERYTNKGIALGEAKGIASSVRALMTNLGMTVQQAMDTLDVPPSLREAVLALL